jgi:hypothetical protein
MQHRAGGLYLFSNWSGVLDSTLRVAAGSAATTYTAQYQVSVASGPLGFATVSPCRLVDTRVAGQGAPALAAGETRTFVASGKCQIPVGAKALAVVLTATGATATGHLRVYPSDQLVPSTSAVNFAPGATRANNALVGLGPAGDFKVRAVLAAASTTHLVVDVAGYYQ